MLLTNSKRKKRISGLKLVGWFYFSSVTLKKILNASIVSVWIVLRILKNLKELLSTTFLGIPEDKWEVGGENMIPMFGSSENLRENMSKWSWYLKELPFQNVPTLFLVLLRRPQLMVVQCQAVETDPLFRLQSVNKIRVNTTKKVNRSSPTLLGLWQGKTIQARWSNQTEPQVFSLVAIPKEENSNLSYSNVIWWAKTLCYMIKHSLVLFTWKEEKGYHQAVFKAK